MAKKRKKMGIKVGRTGGIKAIQKIIKKKNGRRGINGKRGTITEELE